MQLLYCALQGVVFGWTLGEAYSLKSIEGWILFVLNSVFIGLIARSS